MASMRSWLSLVMTSNGSMPGSRAGHGGDVDVHAHAAARRRLAGGAGEAGAAEVLDADDEAGVEQREAGLDQPLLLERVADLHARALGRVGLVVAEAGRGQHAHAADAVAPGGRAEQHGQVADARWPGRARAGRSGSTPRHSTLTSGLLGVGLVEHDLAADGRHADRVAVAGDAADTTPSAIQRLRASSSGPKRSGSISAIGRAPMVKMSRRMPPTPVAAPW